ncbi:hypothetical protein A9K71_21215 [Mesorhizobium sp. WSM3873]|nr:hypothetical protein A9K71_21215 [Mesorhizobium sp. WSM3873]
MAYRPVNSSPVASKDADHRAAVRLQHLDQMVVLSTGVEDQKATPALVARCFDQNFIAHLGNVDRYQDRGGGCRI